MTIGVIILAHEHLHRTKALAKAIASRHVKVMIHVDAATSGPDFRELEAGLSKNAHIAFCERISCEWGQFSLVKAGMGAAEALLERWANVTHVVQISGSCLPVRPIDELTRFLKDNPGRDFVESFPAVEGSWVVDGLGHERFTLYFPFSWKRQRLLFDASVGLQRFFGVSRRQPSGIQPHLGSQWWCLSKRTLKAILTDPERGKYDRHFAKCWIPDEGYVPTLVRKHARDLVCRSLTLSRFDDQGKPHLFYDDHGDILEQTDHFFARKIWYGSDKLYRRFLSKKRKPADRPLEAEFGLDLLFDQASARRCAGRKGRLTVGRFPAAAHERQPATACGYGAFVGFGHVFEGFETWLSRTTGTRAHGRLYKKNAVQFAEHAHEMPGGIVANPQLRDHNPEQFLCNLLWNARDQHQTMMIELSDSSRMCEFLVNDPNTELFVLKGGWILELFARGLRDPKTLKRQALRLSAAEVSFEREVEKAGRTSIYNLTFANLVNDADRVLSDIQHALRPEIDLRPGTNLRFLDFSGFQDFLDGLNKLGVNTNSLGELPIQLPGETIAPVAAERAAVG